MALWEFPQRFRLRGSDKTAADLASINEILLQNEACIERDTGRGKVGDGSTPWNDLPYTLYGNADLTDLADGYVLLWSASRLCWYASPGGYDDEDAQDAIGNILADTATIDATYDDATPSISFDVKNDSITYAKMQNVSATARIIGRKTAGAGDPEEMTLSETLDLIGSAAQGDILYRGSSGWARLPAGTSGYFLKTLGAGANPAWDSAGGGGGAMTYVATSTVAGSDATSVTFSSLDLGTDIEYYIQVVLKNPSAATRTYSLFFNGDTTATNYQRQALNGGGSSATAGNSNDGILFSANASGTATGFIRISKDVDGKARAFSCVSRDAGTSLRLEMTVHQQITASNVTSITIQGSAASMIAIGSTFRLYKVKP